LEGAGEIARLLAANAENVPGRGAGLVDVQGRERRLGRLVAPPGADSVERLAQQGLEPGRYRLGRTGDGGHPEAARRTEGSA